VEVSEVDLVDVDAVEIADVDVAEDVDVVVAEARRKRNGSLLLSLEGS
jgi:hypothetical protein